METNTIIDDIISDLYDRIVNEMKKDKNNEKINEFCVRPIMVLIKNYIRIYLYSFYMILTIFIIINLITLFFIFRISKKIK